MPARRPRKMPTPPNGRRLLLVPAVAGRGGDEAAAEAVAQQRPDRQCGDREGDDCCDGAHGENGSEAAVKQLCGRPFRYRVRRDRDAHAARAAALPRLPRLARRRGRGAALPRLRRRLPDRGRHAADARRPAAGHRGQAARDRGLAGDGEGARLVRARRRGRRAPAVPQPRPRLGRQELARHRALVLAAARPLRAARNARARGGRGEGVGRPAPRAARLRVRGDGHPRRPGDRPRPRRVLRGAGRRFRPRPGRRRAPALRLGGVRRHVLRRRTAPRARHGGDGARDGARDPQGRLGVRAERGHARAWRRRRRPRPGGGEGPRHQRARAHALRVPLGVLALGPRRAARRAGGGLRRAGRSADRRSPPAAARRGAQRGDVLLPELPRLLGGVASMPARAVPRLLP